MLDPASWLLQAQDLAPGGRRRVDHDCGSGRTMVVDHTDRGWSAYCWRCSDQGFVPHPQPSLAERLARLRTVAEAEQEAEADPRPPMPAEFDQRLWPNEARAWVYRAGLSSDTVSRMGIYWCPRLARVVMPVFHEGKLIYWQARSLDKSRPKYINPPVDKPVFKQGSGPVLVICEDMLSTIRVGEVAEAWCAMGTSLPDTAITDILASGKPVKVWLDPDGAGERGRRKYVPKLRAYGISATSIRSERDPKLYSKEEISQLVWT